MCFAKSWFTSQLLENVNISFFIGNYHIVSEDGHEIVDLLTPNAKYQLLANNVPRVSVATGGLLQNTPIICGGHNKMEGTGKFSKIVLPLDN